MSKFVPIIVIFPVVIILVEMFEINGLTVELIKENLQLFTSVHVLSAISLLVKTTSYSYPTL